MPCSLWLNVVTHIYFNYLFLNCSFSYCCKYYLNHFLKSIYFLFYFLPCNVCILMHIRINDIIIPNTKQLQICHSILQCFYARSCKSIFKFWTWIMRIEKVPLVFSLSVKILHFDSFDGPLCFDTYLYYQKSLSRQSVFRNL